MLTTLRHTQSKYVKTAKEVEAEEGKFVWREARFIFVVVFSHAAIKINVKEGAFNIAKSDVSATLQIADVEQGQREYSLKMHSAENGEVRRLSMPARSVRCVGLAPPTLAACNRSTRRRTSPPMVCCALLASSNVLCSAGVMALTPGRALLVTDVCKGHA